MNMSLSLYFWSAKEFSHVFLSTLMLFVSYQKYKAGKLFVSFS